MTVGRKRVRVPVSQEMRERLSEAQNHRCAYCGCDIREAASADHVEPQSRGGSDDWLNLVAACVPCNSSKGRMSASIFFELRQGRLPPIPDNAAGMLSHMIMDAESPVFRRRAVISKGMHYLSPELLALMRSRR